MMPEPLINAFCSSLRKFLALLPHAGQAATGKSLRPAATIALLAAIATGIQLEPAIIAAQQPVEAEWSYVESPLDEFVGWYRHEQTRVRVTWGPGGELYVLALDPEFLASNGGPKVEVLTKGDDGRLQSEGNVYQLKITDGRVTAIEVTAPDGKGWKMPRLAEQPYDQRQVEWTSNGIKLQGTVLLPANARDGTDAVPGVALIQGSGNSDRSNLWAWTFGDGLAQQGIAALIPDKRGCGQSQGEWMTAGFSDLAGDAAASVEVLRQLTGVDRHRCGVVGLSQGGWVAPLAAENSKAAFSASLVASFSTPAEQVRHEMEQNFRREGLSEDDVARMNEAMVRFGEVIAGQREWDSFVELSEPLRSGSTAAAAETFLPKEPPTEIIAFWRGIHDFDFPGLVAKSEVPQLLVYGAQDQRDNTPVAESVARIGALFADDPDSRVELHVYPQVGHALADDTVQWVSPRVIDDLARWIISQPAKPDSAKQPEPSPRKNVERVPQQPCQRHFTSDSFGREITFYLSQEPADGPPLPLVVYIQGSGCGSLFARRGDADPAESVRGQGGHNTLADVVRGKARLLLVEKPGVAFLDEAGDIAGASAEFRQQHTLDRWAEAVGAAMEAARQLDVIDPTTTLVIGHSEGGIVAARVAAERNFVTHVAVLAGGGPPQMFDICQLARAGTFFAGVSAVPEERVEYVLKSWEAIQSNPDSADEMFLGHPYKRWASFCATSTMEQLEGTTAQVLLIQGAADKAVVPETMLMAQIHLLSRQKDVTAWMVPDADHSFALPPVDGQPVDGWHHVLSQTVEWFRSGQPPRNVDEKSSPDE